MPAAVTNIDRRRDASAQAQVIPELPKLPSEEGVLTRKDFNDWISKINGQWRDKTTQALRGGGTG